MEADILTVIDERDSFESCITDTAAALGCEEEWSNVHDHRQCIPGLVDDLKGYLAVVQAENARLLEIIRALTDYPIFADDDGEACMYCLAQADDEDELNNHDRDCYWWIGRVMTDPIRASKAVSNKDKNNAK